MNLRQLRSSKIWSFFKFKKRGKSGQSSIDESLKKTSKSSQGYPVLENFPVNQKNLNGNESEIVVETESNVVDLPNELLSYIFTLCMPSYANEPESLQNWFPSIERFAFEIHGTIRPLVSVCRRWRLIVEGTPALWRNIILGRSLNWDKDLLRKSLLNSGKLPLDVYLRAKLWSGSKARVTELAKLLRNDLDRMRCLIVDIIYESELQGLFPLNDQTPIYVMPTLEVIVTRHLEPNYIDPDENDRLFMGRVYTPNLQYLELAESTLLHSFVSPIFYALRKLSLGSPSIFVPVQTYYQFLACCPNLQSLCFIRTSAQPPEDYESSPSQQPRLTLDHLVTLEFLASYTPDLGTLMQLLSLPSLQTLKFGQFKGDTEEHDPGFIFQFFSHFLVEGADTIRHLSLLFNSLPTESNDFAPLLPGLRNLRVLIIESAFLKPEIIECLLPSEPDQPWEMWPCPYLRTLRVEQTLIETDHLLTLVKRRCVKDDILKEREASKKLALDQSHQNQGSDIDGESEASVSSTSTTPSSTQSNNGRNGMLKRVYINRCSIITETLFEEFLAVQKEYGRSAYFAH
ncbi:hypothetical protein Clacol_005851 [Clathrus columnatus]|uniref:F-box domain-containing protein n=1 Tax=Clathrus columnatus TaxID=1419009 RepID=A0AAV5AFD2_9AGAM|nr:hypothetical protein Clacol_005851 [Clathrus columnatus]